MLLCDLQTRMPTAVEVIAVVLRCNDTRGIATAVLPLARKGETTDYAFCRVLSFEA